MSADEEILAHYGLTSLSQDYWTEKPDFAIANASVDVQSPTTGVHHERNRSEDILRTGGATSETTKDASAAGPVTPSFAMKRSQTSVQPSMSSQIAGGGMRNPMATRKIAGTYRDAPDNSMQQTSTGVHRSSSWLTTDGTHQLLSLMETNFNKFIAAKETIDNVYAQIISTLSHAGPAKTMDMCEESISGALQQLQLFNTESTNEVDISYGELLVMRECEALFTYPEKFRLYHKQEKYSLLMQEIENAKKLYEKDRERLAKVNPKLVYLVDHAWEIIQATIDGICASIWNQILQSQGDFAFVVRTLCDLLKLKPNPISGRDPVLYATVSQQKYLYNLMKERFSYFEKIIKSRQEDFSKLSCTRASPMLVWRAVARGCNLDYTLRGRPEVFAGMQLIEWANACVLKIVREIKEVELYAKEFISGIQQASYPEAAKHYGRDPKQMGVVVEKLNSQCLEMVYSFVGERGERLEMDGAFVLIQLHYFQRVADLLPKRIRTVFSMAATRCIVDTWMLQHAPQSKSANIEEMFIVDANENQVLEPELMVVDVLRELNKLYVPPHREEIVREIHHAFYKVLYANARFPSMSVSMTNWESDVWSLASSTLIDFVQHRNQHDMKKLASKMTTSLPVFSTSITRSDVLHFVTRLLNLRSRLVPYQKFLLQTFPLNEVSPSLDPRISKSLRNLQDLYKLLAIRDTSFSNTTPSSISKLSIQPPTFQLFSTLETIYLELKDSMPPNEAADWMIATTSCMLAQFALHSPYAFFHDIPSISHFLNKCLPPTILDLLQQIQRKAEASSISPTTETATKTRLKFQFIEMIFS
ncbi:Exocyst complex component sec5 [Schizosaccharomyces pombe]